MQFEHARTFIDCVVFLDFNTALYYLLLLLLLLVFATMLPCDSK